MADCGHALCLPFEACRFVVRTQAERDADGTTWLRDIIAIRTADGRMHDPRDVEIWMTTEPVAAAKPPPDIDLTWVTTEPIRPPRRRWWHRYTRPTRKD